MGTSFRLDAAIVGAQKSGTTTLFSLLDAHPDVAGCRGKEPHHFSRSEDWREGFSRYAAQFPLKGRLTLEASTSYSFAPHRAPQVWERLYAHNPDMRILYLVRRPVDRLVSAWRHATARGWEKRPFERAIREVPLYLDATRYAGQIEPYRRRFGESRVKILFFSDLVSDSDAVAADAGDFLGLSAEGFGAAPVHANDAGTSRLDGRHDDAPLFALAHKLAPGLYDRFLRPNAPALPDKPELSRAFKAFVADELKADIESLSAMTGRDLSAWLPDQ